MTVGVKRVGAATFRLDGVYVAASGTAVGDKEWQGPLGQYFDLHWTPPPDSKSFEQEERDLLRRSQDVALAKAGLDWEAVDVVLGGDLLDQLVTTSFAGREHGRPLLGLFAACATFTAGLATGSLLVAGAGAQTVVVSAVSHHFAAERQFRYPVELGNQRYPTASWTATAAGSTILDHKPHPLRVEAVTIGRVVDWGQKDPNDYGSAMAPAAVDTILRHLQATGQTPAAFDAIFTGDLGEFGRRLALRLLNEQTGEDWSQRLDDCGRILYDRKRQDVHNGASGAGCSAAVFGGYLSARLDAGAWHRLLLVATGALLSPTSSQQGESIPGIAHAVAVVAEGG
ncbi:MAG: stage V sporulation protein AD [Firmicutes bacterium]|nr:stage V sporulation protein AD [Alicyclobacillaceae bacterium]MCL6496706.1 stage V sporulation protein AD [Bacillota bacterium]